MLYLLIKNKKFAMNKKNNFIVHKKLRRHFKKVNKNLKKKLLAWRV